MEIKTGFVKDLGSDTKGWFVGKFMPKNSPFHSEDFEVKWVERKKGEVKENKNPPENNQKTVCILIEGEMEFNFPDSNQTVVLKDKGEYLFYSPTPIHKSTALKDSTVIVLRWPSKLP
ncbi:hypothetical protein GW755_02770 [bacterium]|nr:hypothetical protein [bacterium]